MMSGQHKTYVKILLVSIGVLCICVWLSAAGLMALREVLAMAWHASEATYTEPDIGAPPRTRNPEEVEERSEDRPVLPEMEVDSALRKTPPPSDMTAGSTPNPSTVVPGRYLRPTPMAPTPADGPTPSPAFRPTSYPVPTPTPAPRTFNIILLGTDRNEPGKGTWRTDVMALCVIDTESGQVGVLAIPRDLWVNVPQHEPERINTVDFLGHYTKYPGGGPALLNRTLQENFGFGFDRYIRVDFAGFVEIIDTLGGIDLEVDCAYEERFADPAVPGGRLLSVEPGWQHMDGHTALMYIRSRHGTGDADRSRRQFKVLLAVREKVLQLDTITLLPQLWNSYRVSVQTDLKLTEALQMVAWLHDFDPHDIHGQIIDQSMATPWTTPSGAWVLLPDTEKIRNAYANIMNASTIEDVGRHNVICPKPSPEAE